MRRNLLLHGRSASQNPSTRSNMALKETVFSHFRLLCSGSHGENGLVKTTIEDLLKAKEKETSSPIWCHSDDSVYDAAKKMTQHNVGALVVTKPGERKLIAGIITERDYLRKIIIQERPAKATKVGDVMTSESKLISVASDTSILQAMELMTEHGIRHVPVIDGKMVGMVSIRDVVHAIVKQQQGELKCLNEFIRRGY